MNDTELTIKEVVTDLEAAVDEHHFVDVGKGAEKYFGVNRVKFHACLTILKETGEYVITNVMVEQPGTGIRTIVMVLTTADKSYAAVHAHRGDISSVFKEDRDD